MRWAGYPSVVRRSLEILQSLSPEGRDAFLYACSALFAGIAALAMGIPLYRQWGQMAVGPYAAALLMMVVVGVRGPTRPVVPSEPAAVSSSGGGRHRRPGSVTGGRRWKVARVVAFLIVLFGATIVPLAMEVIWRSEGNAALHVQPEVLVVEQAGDRAAHGRDPYRVVDSDGHIVIHEHAEPIYELYYPYLPGMVVFGFSTRE